MSGTHLVTGGTGFVGSGIVLELLRQTQEEVVCIVREGTESVDDRLHKVLEKAARLYGYSDAVISAIKERSKAVPGDIHQALCGVSSRELPHITQFWHCAASLRYEDRYEEEIRQTNVQGTMNALALARNVGIDDYFNYVSTAYVAGRRVGVIKEELEQGNPTNNHYEASKIQAELQVAHADGLQTRIFRPSVVIGHGRTFAVSSGFSGLYGFMRKLLQFKGAMSRVQEGLLSRESIRMRVDANAPLNLVPIDIVARQAVQIGMTSTSDAVFHLTNATPPRVADFLNLLFQRLELREPILVEDREQFSWIDKKLDQGITFYNSYLVGGKDFSRHNSDAVIGDNHAGDYSLDASSLYSYFQWYLDLLAQQRPRLVATR